MKRGYFITGTDTGVGKTMAACAIARSLRAIGRDVGVMKPCETGVGPDGPLDAIALRDAAGCRDPLDDICPVRLTLPAAPEVAATHEHTKIDLALLRDGFTRLSERHETMIVEGAGGLMVPITRDCDMGDLARELGLPVIVVARTALGTINHTLLTLRDLDARGLELAGVVLCHATGELSDADVRNLECLRERLQGRVIGEIPYLRVGEVPEASAIDLHALR